MTDFTSLDDFLATPRLTSLSLSLDGSRLFTTVSTLAPDRKRYVSSIWELDQTGESAAHRLTRSSEGETTLAPAPNGELLFSSKRPWSGKSADDKHDEDDQPAVWSLPKVGEPRQIASRPGGIAGIAVARESGTVVVASPTLPGASDADADAAARKARRDADVNAVLHESSPIRFWDQDLGPTELRLLAATEPLGPGDDAASEDSRLVLRDLTPTPGRALDEQAFVVTPDGSHVVTGWVVQDTPGFSRSMILAIDVASGEQRTIVSEPHVNYEHPRVSPDGRWIACLRLFEGTYDDEPSTSLWLVPFDGGEGRDLLPNDELWPTDLQWSPDSSALFFAADQQGHGPVFRIDIESGDLTRLTARGHHTSLAVHPSGDAIFALADAMDSPPAPVRIDSTRADQDPVRIPAPGGTVVPGRLEEVDVQVADGVRVRGWLSLPNDASSEHPAPLLLWVHGGPVASWNSWSWRWNPWLMVARGYAVLQPDPALSTGYGQHMIRRGWGQWGGAPYDDLMAITDLVIERPDIDETRTAAMGGSYGGYMANWIAGHTDRFRCIVTHASLWALDQFAGTTDMPAYWFAEFGDPIERPERYRDFSPHLHLDKITTPMLVIHGDKDYRVPIGEGLRLWWDLQRTGVESKFLYFPDENHWVLKPGDSKVWYDVVFAWLARHVHGEEWQRPDLV